MVGKKSETKLTEYGTCRGGDFDGSIRRRGQCAGLRKIDVTDHDIGEVDGKNIIGIRIANLVSSGQDKVKHTIQHLLPRSLWLALVYVKDIDFEHTEHGTMKTWHYQSFPRLDACARAP